MNSPCRQDDNSGLQLFGFLEQSRQICVLAEQEHFLCLGLGHNISQVVDSSPPWTMFFERLSFFFFFFFCSFFFFFWRVVDGLVKNYVKKKCWDNLLKWKNLSKLGAGKKKVLHFHMQKGIKIPRKNVHVRGRGRRRLMQPESKKQVKEGGGGGGSFFPN